MIAMVAMMISVRGCFAGLARRLARQRFIRRSGAAMCLPAAFASLLVGVIPSPGLAAARVDVRDQIQRVSGSAFVTLNLKSGQSVSGSFRGFVGDWGDSVQADVRYAAWRNIQPEVLPQFGDAMIVVLASGDTLRGRFKGVGATFLALDTGNTRSLKPVSYETIRSTSSGADASIGPWSMLRPYLQEAPAVTGVLLRQEGSDMLVTSEAIASVRGGTAQASNGNGNLLILVAVAIVAGVLICAASIESSANDAASSASSCSYPNTTMWGLDGRYASSVSGGLAPWAPGETRRP